MLTNCITQVAKSLPLVLLLLALAVASGPALSQTNSPTPAISAPPSSQATPPTEPKSDQIKQRWILSTLIVVLLGIGAVYLARKPQNSMAK
jgi:hypothetical protein